MTGPISRRAFLRKAGLGLLTPYILLTDAEAHRTRWRATGNDAFAFNRFRPSTWTFPQSVASGDPTPSGVVLWTRINPGAHSPSSQLGFQVALDPSFRRMVTQGVIEASHITSAGDYTVRVDLDGRLSSNAVYYYRFIYNQTASRTGRCRTLPAPGEAIDSVRFAVVTCQDFTNGYYGAFSHIAIDPRIDFVVHLGDFIYDSVGDPRFQSLPYADRRLILPSRQPVVFDLQDYRALYRRYRSDPWLQMAMEYHTWVVTWDDHETANDCYWDYERDTLGAPDHPFQVDPTFGNDPARLRGLKLAAQQAWTEYLPTRALFDAGASHPHDALVIYQNMLFGDLVELFMTDERTYRTPHPCGETGIGGRNLARDCAQRRDPGATMLGATQRDWFVDGLVGSSAIWAAWGNEVFLGELTVGTPDRSQIFLSLDAWDGYVAERVALFEALRNGGRKNVVALTGDLHSYLASYLKIDYADPSNENADNVLGVEFMTPSVTSSNLKEQFQVENPPEPGPGVRTGLAPQYLLEGFVRAANPHVQFFNSQDFGYSTVEFTRAHCEYTAYAVDKTKDQFRPPRQTIRRIRVPRDEVRMQNLAVIS